MARVTHAEVTARIETSLGTTQVEAFIDDANLWVTDFLSGEGLSTGRLKRIELYLACHYVTLRDPRLRRQAVEDVAETYQRDTAVTEYLRQAIAEDPTGIVKGRLLDQDETPTVKWRKGVYDPD